MNQVPAVAWNAEPTDTSQPVVEVKVEDFDTLVEQKARETIATIKMSTDQTRLNEAVGKRVAELVEELGLPPPMTEEQSLATMKEQYLDKFKIERLNVIAHEAAQKEFFGLYPEMGERLAAQQVANQGGAVAHGGKWRKKQ